MAGATRLELVYKSGTLTFDVEGEFLPSWLPVYRRNANPPVVVEMRKVWEIRQAKFVSSTVAGLWTKITTLDEALMARGDGHPTAARLIRDPGGAGATIITLGPPTYEQFLVEGLEGQTDALTPHASFRKSGAFDLRVSAVKKNPHSTTGIVGFDQAISYSYERGLARVRARTELSTAEGTDVRTKAQTYAALDIADFGSNYTFQTNGPYGIEFESLDDDDTAGRVPTICVAVSELHEWGINVGTTGPGAYPDRVGYSTRTIVTAKKTRTEIDISAEGPNHESWVRARIPTGALTEDELLVDPANKITIWKGAQETENEKQKTTGRRGEIRVTVTGGHRAKSYEPAAGGHPPVKFVGAFVQWTAVVVVTVEAVGGTGKCSELKLPGRPGEPWDLIENESEEGEPYLEEENRKVDETQDTWRREARLVYRSATPPSETLAAKLASVPKVATLLYPHAS